jgi:hypothetical protein
MPSQPSRPRLLRMTLHVGGVGFQLVRDMPEAVGKMRLDYGDTPELGCGNPIKRRSLS